jgi:ribonuclease-3
MPRRTSRSEAAGTLQQLEHVLGHTFTRPDLLTLAVTHRSFVYEAGPQPGKDLADPSQDNEQLEFMGDAALGLLVAEALCQRFPHSREGELTRIRASLVNRRNLGEVGTRLELGRWLRLGQTAEENDGRRNAALFSNAVEAIIAALYLDGGLPAARQFVEREILSAVANSESAPQNHQGDFKTALQELVQAAALGRPRYHLLEESGPAHRRVFRFAVHLDGAGAEFGSLSEAEGPAKKQAQQEAARLAIVELTQRGALPSNIQSSIKSA